MAKERTNRKAASFAKSVADDFNAKNNSIGASASETAEYVAEMSAELAALAKSSADYIATMTCELSTLAESAQLSRLTELLELVRREAASVYA
ncbi:MAG: hypothetical protein WDN46_19910 [Methylocella sp.]